MDNDVAENLITGLAGLVAGYIIAEGYKRYVSPSTKKSWERDVRMHHGEAGIALFGAGTTSSAFSYAKKNQKALNASLFAIGIGAGFAIHDRKDAHKWFRSRKNFA